MARTAKAATMNLRVLGYKDADGQWVAHCLETDLLGYGVDFDHALSHLHDLTSMQLGFARFKGQPELFFHPAPLHIVEKYAQLAVRALQSLSDKSQDPCHALATMPLPRPRKGVRGSAFRGA